MGNLAEPLLQALGMASGAKPAGGSMVGVIPPENGMMSDAVMGFPSVNIGPRGGISEAGAIPGNTGGMTNETVDTIVQGFKPKKMNFWKALGDQLLKHWGNEPAFEKNLESRNMRSAMEGFTQDPTEAIRRIAQIPGHEKDAWVLLNQLQDNSRASGTLERQNRALDLQNENIMYGRIAGMMNIARPDTWEKMREQAIKIGNSRGVDVSSLIPEQYDPDLAKYIRYGTIKPKDQENLEIRGRNVDSQIQHRGVQQQQGAERLDISRDAEAGRNTRAATAEEGRNVRAVTPRPKAGGGAAATSVLPDGSMFTYNNPDKRKANTAIHIGVDGTKKYLRKLPSGKWKVVAAPKKAE